MEAPYPFCNGYNITIPGYPPEPKPAAFKVIQTFADGALDEAEELNIQMHYWNGADWIIVPSTVRPDSNWIEVDLDTFSQLSPFLLTEPEEENIYTASIWIEPARLNTYDVRGWIHGYIEIEGSFGIGDIDIGTVTCNPLEIDAIPEPDAPAVAAADPSHAVIGDHNGNGVPDLKLRFDRETIVSMFAGTNEAEPFMIRGFMADGYSFFKGTVTIETVDEPVAVALDLHPETINLKSNGKWVTACIEMSEHYSVEEIDRNDLHIAGGGGEELDDPIYAAKKPTSIGDEDQDGIPDLMVKFDRRALQDHLMDKPGIMEIIVEGSLDDGTAIRGADHVKVIHSPFEQFAITKAEIIWDGVAAPDLPHLDAYTVQGIAALDKNVSIHGLTWDVHFLFSLSDDAALYEETVGLTEYCGGFVYVFNASAGNGPRFVEQMVICNPGIWSDGVELPEGLLGGEASRFVRSIGRNAASYGENLAVLVQGKIDCASGWGGNRRRRAISASSSKPSPPIMAALPTEY
jgi:hypothetical protein